MIQRIKPFSNGSEYDNWLDQNCNRCGLWGYCYARRQIEKASWLSGEITKNLYEEIFGEDGKCKKFNVAKQVKRKKKQLKIDKRQQTLF